jgi:hypothetical protein
LRAFHLIFSRFQGLDGTMEAERVRAQLDRILASAAFADADRAGRFLRFVVERTLDGRAGEIKESVIGVEVLGPTRPGSIAGAGILPYRRAISGHFAAHYTQGHSPEAALFALPAESRLTRAGSTRSQEQPKRLVLEGL